MGERTQRLPGQCVQPLGEQPGQTHAARNRPAGRHSRTFRRGESPFHRNRYIQLTGATKSVNRQLEAKTRALGGWKAYTTNLVGQAAEFVIDAYHQLWRIEKSFRMSKHDLRARPVYHYRRESIEAHLSVVFAALAVSHYIEHQTGWRYEEIRWNHMPLPHRPTSTSFTVHPRPSTLTISV